MHAFINPSAPWLKEHIKAFVRQHVPDVVLVDDVGDLPEGGVDALFQFCDGCSLTGHFAAANAAKRSLINAYPNSDALARKDHLAALVGYWTAKRPESILRKHYPHTVPLTLDYAEYVDDALMAADDLSLLSSLEQNEAREPKDREWWILKPALVDSGMGIRLFSTVQELASHLELVENETDDEEEEDDDDDDDDDNDEEDEEEAEAEKDGDEQVGTTKADMTEEQSPTLTSPGLQSLDALFTVTSPTAPPPPLVVDKSKNKNKSKSKRPRYVFKEGGRIPSAQMRAFAAQRYLAAVPTLGGGRKWHIRAYALAVGRLRVYVAREMLVLLAAEPYVGPWVGERPNMRAALTNSAMRDEDDLAAGRTMRAFWDLGEEEEEEEEEARRADWKTDVFEQVCGITAELFRAAAHTMADKFVTVDKAFEVFGLDFLLDTSGNAWLLEVNETPAFYDNPVAGPVALRVLEAVVYTAMEHMGRARVGDDPRHAEVKGRLVEVLDETAKLGKSNITEIIPE
ncbi:tubulin-tyrosine ligase-like protein [Thermothelomyces thermophilus ATCC 42464]|uniref:Tubulin-tyrosine ligase-like protein n=1 Tax=Thermothelomyces thermophilus (strain ATCC 42464 / BCRC 31852 / DSM 1799) TaxID=573729 RepID=G2QLV3_THET4|nr:tubulin-tyrosine ligase-like protein [Thermothelomyces thermophilus ATCC 42464]AEO60933.1 tubulin-tyrosine ligase-like protein [Thermothelomyces thermophilus ATCC 42464]